MKYWLKRLLFIHKQIANGQITIMDTVIRQEHNDQLYHLADVVFWHM